jgi:hypothetical protein
MNRNISSRHWFIQTLENQLDPENKFKKKNINTKNEKIRNSIFAFSKTYSPQ